MVNRHKFIKRLIHGNDRLSSDNIFSENEMFNEIMLMCDLLDHFNFGHAKIGYEKYNNDIKISFEYNNDELDILKKLYKYLSVQDEIIHINKLYSLNTITIKNKLIVTISKEVI